MSELATRTLSGASMIAVAILALWLGGAYFILLCGAVALGVFLEWRALIRKIEHSALGRSVWILIGLLYIGGGAAMLGWLRYVSSFQLTLSLLALVWATDIGAYFAGRGIGGPKIAPKISPSKTWAGLFGGMTAAAAVGAAWAIFVDLDGKFWFSRVLVGTVVALVAQCGDFFESWMKRRAGVKDSGTLIPGHGGLFDRLDGLLAVMFLGAMLAALYASMLVTPRFGSFPI